MATIGTDPMNLNGTMNYGPAFAGGLDCYSNPPECEQQYRTLPSFYTGTTSITVGDVTVETLTYDTENGNTYENVGGFITLLHTRCRSSSKRVILVIRVRQLHRFRRQRGV